MHAYYEFNVMYNVIRQAIKVTPDPTQTGYEAVTMYVLLHQHGGWLSHSQSVYDRCNTQHCNFYMCTMHGDGQSLIKVYLCTRYSDTI